MDGERTTYRVFYQRRHREERAGRRGVQPPIENEDSVIQVQIFTFSEYVGPYVSIQGPASGKPGDLFSVPCYYQSAE